MDNVEEEESQLCSLDGTPHYRKDGAIKITFSNYLTS